jgi:dTDP-4-dehydrorhamnose 3,5-epimerase
MKFTPTKLAGVWVLDLERREDDRGFFARQWCARELEAHGLNPQLAQCSVSFNHKRGTLRGIHLQAAPHAEAKVVRCSRGAIFDVAVDLRPASPTYKQWTAAELSADNGRMLYIPEGCGHGFQTLTDGAEVSYQISEFYFPELSEGILYSDPALGIPWPVASPILSERDRAFPCLG